MQIGRFGNDEEIRMRERERERPKSRSLADAHADAVEYQAGGGEIGKKQLGDVRSI